MGKYIRHKWINLCNKSGKIDKIQDLQSILSFFATSSIHRGSNVSANVFEFIKRVGEKR